MFDFLFRKNDEIVSYADLITLNVNKLQLYDAANEKAVNMIAKAIAKSEIVLTDEKSMRITDEKYFRLNIRPNDNETGTDFWFRAVQKLLKNNECLICQVGKKFYIVENYQENSSIFSARKYTDITINMKNETIRLNKTITSDDMIVLRWKSEKQMAHFKKVSKIYEDTISGINQALQIMSSPKFKLKLGTKISLMERQPDGTDKSVTKDEYIAKLKRQLEENEISILTSSEGVDLDYFKYESSLKTEDLLKLSKEIESETARMYDIPESVFFGNITEKSDATNEFITYAVSPVAEIINDSLNAKLVGEDDYIKGERIRIWLSRFKHIDVVDSAANLEKLRGIGFTLDEIREMVGYDKLYTEFSSKRLFTKNFASEEESEDK